jgi:hypothetical protein
MGDYLLTVQVDNFKVIINEHFHCLRKIGVRFADAGFLDGVFKFIGRNHAILTTPNENV